MTNLVCFRRHFVAIGLRFAFALHYHIRVLHILDTFNTKKTRFPYCFLMKYMEAA